MEIELSAIALKQGGIGADAVLCAAFAIQPADFHHRAYRVHL